MTSILAVDDMRSMRELVQSVLEKRGYTVSTAEDGLKALAAAQKAPFDLIIADINMPNLDGVDLIKHLRGLPGYETTPILMLTTESADEKKRAARTAGANGWIQKPFNPERLANAVEKTLAKQR